MEDAGDDFLGFDGSALFDGVLAGDWRPGLRELAASVRSAAIGITFRIPDRPVSQCWLGLDAAFEAAYTRHYHRYDPWLKELERRGSFPEGVAYLGKEIVAPRVLARNEVIQELHRSSGLGDLQGATLVTTGDCVITLGMMRAVDDVPFTAADRETMQQLVPHWQRALRIAALRERVHAAATFATFWADASGRILDLDARARALLADDDGLALIEGRLVLFSPADDLKLRRALARPGKKAFFPIQRRSERRPYLVELTGDAYGVTVRIHDREELSEGPADALRRWFGVTRTEAALMVELTQGKTPSELAEERGVAISTIRSQLSSIFAKTGTRRQAELVALVARVSGLSPGSL